MILGVYRLLLNAMGILSSVGCFCSRLYFGCLYYPSPGGRLGGGGCWLVALLRDGGEPVPIGVAGWFRFSETGGG